MLSRRMSSSVRSRRAGLQVRSTSAKSEDAPRVHLAGEDVGFASRSKPSPILAHCSSETVIVQFWSAEKIVVRVHHRLHGAIVLASLIARFVTACAEATGRC